MSTGRTTRSSTTSPSTTLHPWLRSAWPCTRPTSTQWTTRSARPSTSTTPLSSSTSATSRWRAATDTQTDGLLPLHVSNCSVGSFPEHGSLWWHRPQCGDGVSGYDAERPLQGALRELVHWQEERSHHRWILCRRHTGQGKTGWQTICEGLDIDRYILFFSRKTVRLCASCSTSCRSRRRSPPCPDRSCSWRCQWTTSPSRPTLTTSRPASSSGLSNPRTW